MWWEKAIISTEDKVTGPANSTENVAYVHKGRKCYISVRRENKDVPLSLSGFINPWALSTDFFGISVPQVKNPGLASPAESIPRMKSS